MAANWWEDPDARLRYILVAWDGLLRRLSTRDERRDGVCLCGARVAAHFDKDNRKHSCRWALNREGTHGTQRGDDRR